MSDCDWAPDSIPLPEPCPGCGSRVAWWNDQGEPRCMTCRPPAQSLDLLKARLTIRPNRVARSCYNGLLKASGMKYNPQTQRHER